VSADYTAFDAALIAAVIASKCAALGPTIAPADFAAIRAAVAAAKCTAHGAAILSAVESTLRTTV
jgi:hypothetical protein